MKKTKRGSNMATAKLALSLAHAVVYPKCFQNYPLPLIFPFSCFLSFFSLSTYSTNSLPSSHFPYHGMINLLWHTRCCTRVCIPVWQKAAFDFTCASGLPLKVISSTSQGAASQQNGSADLEAGKSGKTHWTHRFEDGRAGKKGWAWGR